MKLDIQRFQLANSPFGTGGSMIDGSVYMSPNAISGEWCKYDEVCAVVEQALKNLSQNHEVKCLHRVEMEGTRNTAHTYCYLPLGHEGNCKP
jgi:hypothetical protein